MYYLLVCDYSNLSRHFTVLSCYIHQYFGELYGLTFELWHYKQQNAR